MATVAVHMNGASGKRDCSVLSPSMEVKALMPPAWRTNSATKAHKINWPNTNSTRCQTPGKACDTTVTRILISLSTVMGSKVNTAKVMSNPHSSSVKSSGRLQP